MLRITADIKICHYQALGILCWQPDINECIKETTADEVGDNALADDNHVDNPVEFKQDCLDILEVNMSNVRDSLWNQGENYFRNFIVNMKFVFFFVVLFKRIDFVNLLQQCQLF